MSKDRKHTGARLAGRLALRIIANSIAALAAGYLYETGRKAADKRSPSQLWQAAKALSAELVGQSLGNLLADSDAYPASEEASTGRFSGTQDL